MEISERQLYKLADIFADMGQVVLASVAIPFLLGDFRPLVAVTGLGLSLALWYASLVSLR